MLIPWTVTKNMFEMFMTLFITPHTHSVFLHCCHAVDQARRQKRLWRSFEELHAEAKNMLHYLIASKSAVHVSIWCLEGNSLDLGHLKSRLI